MDVLVGKKRIENTFKGEFSGTQTLQKKEGLIFRKEKIYFVESGALKKVVHGSEKDLALAFYGPGDFTYSSGNAFIDNSGMKEEISFISLSHNTAVKELSSKGFKKMITESSHKAAIYKSLGVDATLKQLLNEERLTMKLTKKSSQQIAWVIYKMALLYGRELVDNNGWVMKFPTAHADIGSFIGCSRQTVTQTMNDLRNNGIIEFDRNKIYIKNINILKDIVDSNKK